MPVNPRLKFEQLLERVRVITKLKGGDIALVGSYNTLNTGDILILETVKEFLVDKGYNVKIFGKYSTDFSQFDKVIVCGGDVLHDRSESHWSWLNKIARNKNVLFIGVGVPGFYLKTEKEVKELLEKIAFIIVRDQISYKRLKKLGYNRVDKSFDNAFLLYETNSSYPQGGGRKKHLGISIKTFASTKESKEWSKNKFRKSEKVSLNTYIAFYQAIIENYRTGYDKVVVISMTKSDEIFAKKHFKNEVDDIYPYTKSTDKLLNRIQTVEAMFCTRYHSLVLSLIAGKPFQCFAYADKVENLCREIGFTDFYSREDLAPVNSNSAIPITKKLTFVPEESVRNIAYSTNAKIDKVVHEHLLK